MIGTGRNSGPLHLGMSRRFLPCFFTLAAAFTAVFLAGCAVPEKPRWIPAAARFEGRPLRLIADTGAEDAVIWTSTAERYGWSIVHPPPNTPKRPGMALLGITAPGTLHAMGATFPQTRLRTFAIPKGLRRSLSIDGVLGWAKFRDRLFRIDAARRRLVPIASPPRLDDGWQKFRIYREARVLEIELLVDGRMARLLIDTGSEFGLDMPRETWGHWLAAHPEASRTVGSFFTPSIGRPALREVSWAPSFDLGPLRITDLLIEHQPDEKWKTGSYAGKIGLAGLERLDCVVDGVRGEVYLRPKRTSSPPPDHNRLGATFHPASFEGKDWIAHVVPGSPAARAGIRDGDVLLSIGAAQISGNPSPSPSIFFRARAGTRLELTLRRGKETHRAQVTLADLLGPAVKFP